MWTLCFWFCMPLPRTRRFGDCKRWKKVIQKWYNENKRGLTFVSVYWSDCGFDDLVSIPQNLTLFWICPSDCFYCDDCQWCYFGHRVHIITQIRQPNVLYICPNLPRTLLYCIRSDRSQGRISIFNVPLILIRHSYICVSIVLIVSRRSKMHGECQSDNENRK